MRASRDDENPHAFMDEFQNAPERVNTSEREEYREHINPEEKFRADEHPFGKAESKPKQHSEKGKSFFTQYLSMIAVTLTGAVLLAAPAFSKEISASVAFEDIGLESYSCEIAVENSEEETELIAVLTDEEGAIVSEKLLDGGADQAALSYSELSPGTEYTLTVSEASGNECLSHTFSTDAFVSFGESENERIPFYLHEDVQLESGMDTGVSLYGSENQDFSSNLYLDLEGVSYIITDGLYKDTYSFTMELYMPDELGGVKRYAENITLGELEALEFKVTASDTLITFEYLSGDMDFYTDFEVELSNESNFYIFYGEDISVENGTISASITEIIESGSYVLSVWGMHNSGEIYLLNQIYVTEITI